MCYPQSHEISNHEILKPDKTSSKSWRMLTAADLAGRIDMDHRGDRGEMHDMGDMDDRMI